MPLAHGSGIDELVLLAALVAVGAVVWLRTRRGVEESDAPLPGDEAGVEEQRG